MQRVRLDEERGQKGRMRSMLTREKILVTHPSLQGQYFLSLPTNILFEDEFISHLFNGQFLRTNHVIPLGARIYQWTQMRKSLLSWSIYSSRKIQILYIIFHLTYILKYYTHYLINNEF